MEPQFIQDYDALNSGYNLTDGGDGKRGYRVSDETKRKISKSLKGKPLTDDTKAKISAIKKGVKFTDQHRANKSSTWKVIHPDGTECVLVNMEQFCRDNGLNSSTMSQVAKGNRPHHKGYRCLKL